MFRLKLNQIVFKKFKTLDLNYDKSNKHLRKIKYIILCTGCQGSPG